MEMEVQGLTTFLNLELRDLETQKMTRVLCSVATRLRVSEKKKVREEGR